MKKLIGFLAVDEKNKKVFLREENGLWKIFEFSVEIPDSLKEKSSEVRYCEMQAIKQEFSELRIGVPYIDDFLSNFDEVRNDELTNLSVYHGMLDLSPSADGIREFSKSILEQTNNVSIGTRAAVDMFSRLFVNRL